MKKTILFIIILILIVAAVMYWKPSETPATVEQATDTTASIDEDLNSISADGDFEADMQSLDSDINSL